MTQEQRLIAFAQGIAGDVKLLTNRIGDLTSLSTTAKGNVVAAINELYGLIGQAGAKIDDTAGAGATAVTWSADKSVAMIAQSAQAVKDSLLNGAGAAYDTFKELQDLITGDETLITALTQKVGEKVSFAESQTLTTAQRLQACTNIGIGDPDTDILAAYTAAKA